MNPQAPHQNDAPPENDASPQQDTDKRPESRQLGHKRPWWNFNVITLLVALFVFVWIRYLLDLSQGPTIAMTLFIFMAWGFMGAIGQSSQQPSQPWRPQQWRRNTQPRHRAPHVPAPPQHHVPLHILKRDEVATFTTKDGSQIRELLAYRNSCVRRQSLAEAQLTPGSATTPHFHPHTEEIYYVLAGVGRMQLEREIREVYPGDAIAIPPRARHQITNIGNEPLVFLCCCVPAYEHEDTVLVTDWPTEEIPTLEEATAANRISQPQQVEPDVHQPKHQPDDPPLHLRTTKGVSFDDLPG